MNVVISKTISYIAKKVKVKKQNKTEDRIVNYTFLVRKKVGEGKRNNR